MCNGKHGGCVVHKACKVLMLIGGLNWGLVGVGMLMGSDLNVVHLVVGSVPTLEAVVYVLVGLAAVMKLFSCKCKKCMEACTSCQMGDMDKKM